MASSEPRSDFDLSRLIAFSDGVFAIAITLLVLSIDVPNAVSASALPAAVFHQSSDVLSYVISFLVVGNFWVVHHRVFARLERCDARLLWLNLLFLLFIVFIPYPTAVLGDFDGWFSVSFYAATIAASWLSLTVLWLYVTHADRLVDDRLEPWLVRRNAVRFLYVAGVFLVSIPLSLLSTTGAMLFWFVLFFMDPVVNRLVPSAE